MRTKFVVEMAVTFTHVDGVKILKKDVSEYLKEVLELHGPPAAARMSVSKATVRSVDKD